MTEFLVIIVGGGHGGLTLANCLQHAGIDFLLLEGREKIGLHVGAGVGMEANGNRILEQLGILTDLEDELIPNRVFTVRDSDGKLLYARDRPRLITKRTGYYPWIHDRQRILEAVYNRILDKEKVLVNKRVRSITYRDDLATVICDDNSEYSGNVIVGCDGVNSIVRREMWRICDQEEHGRISDDDKKFLSVEYRGLYGVAGPVAGLEPGSMTFVLGSDETYYWMVGKDRRSYFAAVEKLEKQLRTPNIPRYNEEDAEAFARGRLDKVLISDTAQVKFGDLWAQRQRWALVPVEEGELDTWTVKRIVCIGDSVHKVTPESGQGSSQAVESAACLANHLKRMLDKCNGKVPALVDIEACLRQVQTERRPRAIQAVQQTNLHVRLFTCQTYFLKLMIRTISPLLGDMQTDMMCERYIGAVRVDFLPIPERSTRGTMLFNPSQGNTKQESRKQRAIFALPLLLLIGSVHNSTRWVAEPILQLLLLPIYLVWMIEGSRRANHFKIIQWMSLFGLLSCLSSFTVWSNIWFFLYTIWSPIETYAARDNRLLQMNWARAILPSLICSVLLPMTALLMDSKDVTGFVLATWSYLPILLAVTQLMLGRLIEDTTNHDRLYNTEADLPSLRKIYITGISIAVALDYYVRFSISASGDSASILPTYAVMGQQYAPLYLGGIFCLVLLFRDLKKAEMVQQNWLTLWVCLVLSILVIGPGATFLAGWAWREEILATKWHAAAVTG